MTAPEIATDRKRLAALEAFAILDTPAEAGFDDIAQLAAHICGTPVALVSFVAGDRQWFKAAVGFEQCETDLQRSVCVHAMTAPDIVIIPDLTLDERSKRNPLVTGEPGIRFYAGAPLVAITGEPLGSLCVIDTQPRPQGLDSKQRDMLRALARQVMSQLELRRAVGERDNESAARRISEARERTSMELYRSLFDAIDAGFCIIEMKFDGQVAQDYRFVEVNPAFAGHTGLQDARGKWAREIVPNLEQHWFDLYGKVARSREPILFENVAKELGPRWFEVYAFPVGPVDANQVGLLFKDISDGHLLELQRQEAEAAQSLVNEELNHRMKNVFAMVQAIASQTLRSIADKMPVENFTARIHALSRAHDVLFRQNWNSAPIGEVVKSALRPLVDLERVGLAGPNIDLGARATLSLSLLVHELATNALKYGALSVDGGRVTLSWRSEGVEGEARLVLSWQEVGGPPVVEPERAGFGSKLIRMGLGGSNDVDLRYLPSGLHAEFRAPLDQIMLPIGE